MHARHFGKSDLAQGGAIVELGSDTSRILRTASGEPRGRRPLIDFVSGDKASRGVLFNGRGIDARNLSRSPVPERQLRTTTPNRCFSSVGEFQPMETKRQFPPPQQTTEVGQIRSYHFQRQKPTESQRAIIVHPKLWYWISVNVPVQCCSFKAKLKGFTINDNRDENNVVINSSYWDPPINWLVSSSVDLNNCYNIRPWVTTIKLTIIIIKLWVRYIQIRKRKEKQI